MAIVIGGMIIGVNKVHVLLTVAIFVASLIALVVVLVMENRQAPKVANTVDHNRLAGTQFLPYGNWLKENLRGHDVEIDEIVGSIQEELNLARPGKIIGAYLLVGPTGTGKTFLAQLAAQALYPKSEAVILRMNQLKHPDDVFTLLGPPPGRPGYEVGGSLTRPVLENPYRVVILDEIEKCHRDLHHCLYDILDTAQCREKSSGKMVDFSGCVFFGTSNAAVEQLRTIFSRTSDPNIRATESRDALYDAGGFDKAFLARWNQIVLMDELSPVHVAEVALLQLCVYWKTYGMEITYVPPELLLEAVERNEEFRSYGVRQLSTFIKHRTNHAISEARTQKMTKLHLDVSPDGNILVKPVA